MLNNYWGCFSQIFFVESYCEDVEIVKSNIMVSYNITAFGIMKQVQPSLFPFNIPSMEKGRHTG